MTMLKKALSFIILGGIAISLFLSCSKKSDTPAGTSVSVPVLSTDVVTAILTNSAKSGGTVTSDGGAPVTQRGVCWSRTPSPLVSGMHTVDGSGTGSYTSTMTGLDTNSLYYVRAYATNSQGTAYGNTLSFITLKLVVYGFATDVDGNKYPVVKIGQQYWLQKNLRVDHYRNGDAIPRVTGDDPWKVLATGAYCDYDNQSANDTTYGNLYNWHALGDSRGLCPSGWHVPAGSEWKILADFLGGNTLAGGALKSTGTIEQSSGLWYVPNTGATNSSGFTALPGGYRINYGTFYSLGNVAYFWSASDTATVNAWNYILDANNGELSRIFSLKTNGFSIRCCRD